MMMHMDPEPGAPTWGTFLMATSPTHGFGPLLSVSPIVRFLDLPRRTSCRNASIIEGRDLVTCSSLTVASA